MRREIRGGEESSAGLRPALQAGEERGEGAGRFAFAVEERMEMRESGEEFAGMEEMFGAARTLGVGELQLGERFVEEMAAGSESALYRGEERAMEIVEAEDEVEGGFGKAGGFQVGFHQHNA